MGEFELSENCEEIAPDSFTVEYQPIDPENIQEGMAIAVLYDPIRASSRIYRTGVVTRTFSARERNILVVDASGCETLIKSFTHEGIVTGYSAYDRSDNGLDCIGEVLRFYSVKR